MLQADPSEDLLIQSYLDKFPASPSGTSSQRIKRYTWGEGVDGSAGQRYAVEVVTNPHDVSAARIQTKPMVCYTAQREALQGNDHTHNDTTCDWGEAPEVTRWWGYLSLQQAILAALRWEADSEAEPFGWTRAYDGRIRPNGDPAREAM